MSIHIVKLCVGCDTLEDLAAWQEQHLAAGRELVHVTRQTPRREGFGPGSSLYWVIGGFIRARQRIAGLREVRGGDGVMRCGLELDPRLAPTDPAPRRPFQGWRYLDAADAPKDLDLRTETQDGAMPAAMRAALAELALI
jgi:hypothetical protein